MINLWKFLEWFDFAIFGLLATEIGENFFPDGAAGVQLIEAFAVYAGAFCMRPLGGALFGYIGDKFGRLNALRISIFMMAIPTFLTGSVTFSTHYLSVQIQNTLKQIVFFVEKFIGNDHHFFMPSFKSSLWNSLL